MTKIDRTQPCAVPGIRPVLISIPHDGHEVPAGIAERMTETGRALPDTDWYVSRLYHTRRLADCSRLEARWSRYVVDLNRPPDGAALYPGQAETGICPVTTFDGRPIYRAGAEPDAREIEARLETYWSPYHRALASELHRLRDGHGCALLWEAHSIRSRVPRLFDGALPDFNFGTDGGRTCPAEITDVLAERVRAAGYTAVVNGRFRGGYTTRHYGAPGQGQLAIQLELSQATYLDEQSGEVRPQAADAVADLIADLVELAESALAPQAIGT